MNLKLSTFELSSFPYQVQDVGAEKDAITSLRAPTHFGRPNWDRVFSSLTEKHPDSDVGVFFCGPSAISRTLHTKCNEYSTPHGTKFFFGKGEFFSRTFFVLGTLQSPAGLGSTSPWAVPWRLGSSPFLLLWRPDTNVDATVLTLFVAENF